MSERLSQSLERRLKLLLEAVAELHRPCRLCGADLYFIRHRDGSLMPYSVDGENHYFACSKAGRLRQERRAEQTPLLDTRPVPD